MLPVSHGGMTCEQQTENHLEGCSHRLNQNLTGEAEENHKKKIQDSRSAS
jgi:hypothetical protein